MKTFLLILISVVFTLGFISNKLLNDKIQKVLTQFNISEDFAKRQILSNIAGPSYYIPNVRILKNLALGERAELVKTIGMGIKEYVSSEEFIKNYNQYREDRKPGLPEEPKYSEQLKKEHKESLTKSISEMEKQMTTLPADQKAMFQDVIGQLKQQLKDVDDPNNPMFSSDMDTYIKQGYDMQIETYKTQMTEWEKAYPLNNPKPMIKSWINEFLEKSKDIDFNAQLKNEKGKQIFVNSAYERKDNQWKLYFRAGKEPVETARIFSQQWLKEL
jgi:uncharacterized membrane protein YheB (UPF0754 family)